MILNMARTYNRNWSLRSRKIAAYSDSLPQKVGHLLISWYACTTRVMAVVVTCALPADDAEV
jgi:hypothetical protein